MKKLIIITTTLLMCSSAFATFGVSKKISKMVSKEINIVDGVLKNIDTLSGLESGSQYTPWEFSKFRYTVRPELSFEVPFITKVTVKTSLEFHYSR